MKKVYLTGLLVSGLVHLPLVKQKEYASYAISTLGWPVPAILWVFYIRYLTWGTFQHRKMVRNKSGVYKDS